MKRGGGGGREGELMQPGHGFDALSHVLFFPQIKDRVPLYQSSEWRRCGRSHGCSHPVITGNSSETDCCCARAELSAANAANSAPHRTVTYSIY